VESVALLIAFALLSLVPILLKNKLKNKFEWLYGPQGVCTLFCRRSRNASHNQDFERESGLEEGTREDGQLNEACSDTSQTDAAIATTAAAENEDSRGTSQSDTKQLECDSSKPKCSEASAAVDGDGDSSEISPNILVNSVVVVRNQSTQDGDKVINYPGKAEIKVN
jgi:hypothetical protein